MTDVLIIGAGHNGLVCAAYLARAGMDVLVLESSGSAGGMSAPRTVSDDYRFPGLAHVTYPVSKLIRKDLRLDRYGYEAGPAIDTIALDTSGEHLVIAGDSVSGSDLPEADARAFPAFKKQYLEVSRKIRPLFDNKPPRLKNMGLADARTLARLGWNIRVGLGKEAMYEFLRVAAINIYDVLDDVFQAFFLCGGFRRILFIDWPE